MILLTGASGAMGSVLASALHARGARMRACVLPGDTFVKRIEGVCEDIRFGDISNADDIIGICTGITTVYHLAAIILSKDDREFGRINVEGTRNCIAEAKAAGVRHFIYISSASVTYPRPTPYSLSKSKAEELVKNSGLHYTIIRPTLVYGPTGGQEFDNYLGYLKKFPIIPFIGKGRALKRPVYVDDVISGLVALNDCKKAYGKIFNLSGGQAINMLDFSRLCLMLLGKPQKIIIHLPVWLCTIIALIMRMIMDDPPLKWQTIAGIIQDADLDPGLAASDLGYDPGKLIERLPGCFPRK
jgi:nucleoside-diphosphate-sugar epimerase